MVIVVLSQVRAMSCLLDPTRWSVCGGWARNLRCLWQRAGLSWLYISVPWSAGCVTSPVLGGKLPLKGRVGAGSATTRKGWKGAGVQDEQCSLRASALDLWVISGGGLVCRACPRAGTGEGSLLRLSLQITSPQDHSEQLLLQGQRRKWSRDAANPIKCVILMGLTDGHQPTFISLLSEVRC